MNIDTINQYFNDFGVLSIFVIVLLEYMNLPGFPAGIIMPLAGAWASNGKISFLMTMVITSAAGLIGSWILYWVGLTGGQIILNKYLLKHPKHKEKINKAMIYIEKKGIVGILVCKLLPMIRTIISIPAGVLKMNIHKYMLGSLIGIIIWNFFFVGAGYIFGEKILNLFGRIL